MAEKTYIVTLENDTTHNVLFKKIVFTRVDAEVIARVYHHLEKYGNTVYIRVEKE